MNEGRKLTRASLKCPLSSRQQKNKKVLMPIMVVVGTIFYAAVFKRYCLYSSGAIPFNLFWYR